MNQHQGRIVVVGAGLSGTALTCRLLRELPRGSRITLIGSPDEIGVGLAYRPICPDFLVNVPAAGMSIDANDPGHFVRWLAGQPAAAYACPLDMVYARRSDYGRYLRDSLASAIRDANDGVIAEIVRGTVVEIGRDGDGFTVRLASGEHFAAGHVALCLGNSPARFPIARDRVERDALPRLIADPWNDYRMNTIAPDARVLFIGAGLTMIDQVLMLRRNGFSGSAIALSRRGLLPAAHSADPGSPATIELPARGALNALARAVIAAARRAEADGGDWRTVINGLRPATQDIWQGLTIAEKRRFRRHLESFWSVHRHRMAPEIGAKVDALRQRGLLAVVAGRIDAVRANGTGLRVGLRRRGSPVVEIQPFDWIVNCTGPGRLATHAGSPLVAQMLKDGLIRADEMDLGIDVDGESRALSAAGIPSPALSALGPVTAGRFWEILAVREIRAQAAAVADRIAAGMTASTAEGRVPQGYGPRLAAAR
jgi:uncharacterized NAD(P)/FAD-binding protein YdhS